MSNSYTEKVFSTSTKMWHEGSGFSPRQKMAFNRNRKESFQISRDLKISAVDNPFFFEVDEKRGVPTGNLYFLYHSCKGSLVKGDYYEY